MHTSLVTRSGKRGQERPESPGSCMEERRSPPCCWCDTATTVSPTFTSSSYRGILCTGLIIRSDRACFSLFSRMLCCKTPVRDKDGPFDGTQQGHSLPLSQDHPFWFGLASFRTIQSDSGSSQLTLFATKPRRSGANSQSGNKFTPINSHPAWL